MINPCLRLNEGYPIEVKNSMVLQIESTSDEVICLKSGDILGTITKGLYGTCALVDLDEKEKKLVIQNSFDNLFAKPQPFYCIEDFGTSDGAKIKVL